MLQRKPVFPHVIEMNYQAGQRLGCNVYLVFDGNEWLLIDVGFDETVDEIVELIRQLDFPLSQLQDADRHARRRRSHSGPGEDQATAQDQDHRPSPGGRTAGHGRQDQDLRRDRGSGHSPGNAAGASSTRWSTTAIGFELANSNSKSGTRPATPTASFRSAWADLLFSGDNIYRDGCVGAIDAHHGSDIPAFIKSLRAHSRQRRRVAAAQPRPDLSQGQRPVGPRHRAAGRLSAHGRLRHLRDRLAADGRVGQRAGRRQDAAVREVGSGQWSVKKMMQGATACLPSSACRTSASRIRCAFIRVQLPRRPGVAAVLNL